MKLLILICLWIFWCSLHSALISVRATAFFKKRLKTRFKYFRIAYNGFALVSIVPVLIYSQGVQGRVFFSWNGGFSFVYILLWAVVILLGYQGGKAYDLRYFSGFNPGPDADALIPGFSTRGILGITRHPWYLAGLIFLWIRSCHIHLPMMAENFVLTFYLVLGMVLEERKLIQSYGGPYLAYRRRVSPLIPFKWVTQGLRQLISGR